MITLHKCETTQEVRERFPLFISRQIEFHGKDKFQTIPLFESDVDDGDGVELLEVAGVGLVRLQDVGADLKKLTDRA